MQVENRHISKSKCTPVFNKYIYKKKNRFLIRKKLSLQYHMIIIRQTKCT